jgi:putative Mn2+ efflux pump MntP
VRLPASSPEPGVGRVRRGLFLLGGGLDRQKVISCRQALALGVGLALNNAVAGVGAGVAGASPLVTTLLAGALSLICVGGGSRLGLSLARLLGGSRASLISGVILLGVGAMILTGVG